MKVLMLCNGLMEQLKEKHGISHGKPESWINGVYNMMQKTPDLEVMYLFPSQQKLAFSEGNVEFRAYPQADIDRLESEQIELFAEYVRSFMPDVVHVFGTEYVHTYAMIKACENLGCQRRILVHIQGLVSVYASHYCANIPLQVLRRKTFRDLLRGGGIDEGQRSFQRRGRFEAEVLRKAVNISGRTDWDEACVKLVNPDAKYFFCNETLRDAFYTSPKWSVSQCERHSIFISQAGYPIKGFHLFLEALPAIIRKYPDVHVYTTGKSPIPQTFMQRIKQRSYPKYLESLIRDNHLEEYITFTGWLDEESMCKRFLKSHVFVMPSSIENSPNSLGEAMLLGVPCISSDVGGVKNLMTHGSEGFIYPADEPYIIPYYVDKIFSSDELAGEFSRNAQAHAAKIHDREENFRRLMSIYREIAGEECGR